jgi:hypothetical protein
MLELACHLKRVQAARSLLRDTGALDDGFPFRQLAGDQRAES